MRRCLRGGEEILSMKFPRGYSKLQCMVLFLDQHAPAYQFRILKDMGRVSMKSLDVANQQILYSLFNFHAEAKLHPAIKSQIKIDPFFVIISSVQAR
ncbi:hypothetical protein SUGI_0227360 [Cryptomeria japonica]|nr:hypothetical protein SUGI_0227360 [Cryptomeria japonica]